MQLKQYQANQLKYLLSSELKQNITGILTLETQVNSWHKPRIALLVVNNGQLVYADSIVPSNQQLAKRLGDKLQPNFINAALPLAIEKLTNPQSVRELIEILVKLRIFKWDTVEAYIHHQVISVLERFDAHPGKAKWKKSHDFDLCFGEDRHGLNWTKLKQDLSDRKKKWTSLAPTIPSMDAVPYISASSLAKVTDLRVSKHLKRYVNGRRTLVDIAISMGKDSLIVANSYLNWVNSGVVSFVDPTEAEPEAGSIPDEISDVSLPKVLSVDDSMIVQISIKRSLSGYYNVLFASNAVEALKVLNRNAIDLLLLDLTMPEVDGLEFCKIIRKIPKFHDLPVVMVTARDGFMDRVKGQMAGTNKYITKPFTPEELLEVVNKYIKVSQV